MRHIKLVVQYDGTNYAGFQIQPDAPTIQGELQKAIAAVVNEQGRLVAASRTDAGVHAVGQVVRVDIENPIPVDGLVRAVNESLPADIAVVEGQLAPRGFHPRYDAVSKAYEYRIRMCRKRSPFLDRYAWRLGIPLDVAAMQQAGSRLVGEHDFAAFAVAGGSAATSVRTLYELECVSRDTDVRISVCGDGFLYMMVRSIVGTLVEVGTGKRAPESLDAVLSSRNRSYAGKTAPPQGLFLVRVSYAGEAGTGVNSGTGGGDCGPELFDYA